MCVDRLCVVDIKAPHPVCIMRIKARPSIIKYYDY